jgi:hypothetical protein
LRVGRRSTLFIVLGLLIAVGPVLAAGLGALLVQAYGRSGFAELLQWSLFLLVISIPLGAALVVAGGVMKIAQDRARREAGIADPVRLRDWLPHMLLGAFLIVAPAYLGMDIRGRQLSSAEAWEAGASAIYIGGGLLLIVLALFVRTGAPWVRWPMALWCLAYALGYELWMHYLQIGVFQPVELGVNVFVAAIWMWLHLRRI